MHVTRVRLRDFRNYERAEVELGRGLTVVAGANGAGKTNLLESIYFGLTARSCRAHRPAGAPTSIAWSRRSGPRAPPPAPRIRRHSPSATLSSRAYARA